MRMTNLQWPPVPWLSPQPFHTTQRPTRMARWCIVDLLIAQTAFLWNLEFLNHDLPSTFPCMSVVILIPSSPERCCPFPPRFFCFSISLAPHWFILFLQQMLTWHLWCARQCSGPRDATELRVLQPLLHWWTTHVTFAMHPRHLWLVSSFGIQGQKCSLSLSYNGLISKEPLFLLQEEVIVVSSGSLWCIALVFLNISSHPKYCFIL